MRNFCRPVPLAALSLVLVAAGLDAQYGGPSMLSRGGNSPGVRGRAPVDLTWYAGVRSMYESGLIAPTVDAEGTLSPSAGWGTQVEGGLFGGHDWRRSSFGIDYRGDYRYQPTRPGLDGSSHAVALQYQHRIGRRLQAFSSISAGTTNRAFGNFAIPAFGDTSRYGVPIAELFDTRMYFGQLNAGLGWRKSARLTLQAAGSAFVIKRKSLSLFNGQGYGGTFTATYQRTSRTSILGEYQYMDFRFPRAYSESSIHGARVGIQHRISRSFAADVSVGAFLARISGVESVTLSPEIAAILGRPTGTVVFERTATAPNFAGTFSWIQERGRAFISAESGVVPGNGVYLTTNRRSVRAGYSYSGMRRTSLGVSGGYSANSSLGLNLSSIAIWQGGGGVSYKLTEYIHASGQYDYRWFSSASTPARTGSVIYMGLTVSPSRLPLPIW